MVTVPTVDWWPQDCYQINKAQNRIGINGQRVKGWKQKKTFNFHISFRVKWLSQFRIIRLKSI